MSYKQLNTNIIIPFIREISSISNSISRSSMNIDLINKIDILKKCIFSFNRLKDVPYTKIEDLTNSLCETKEDGIIIKRQEIGEGESKHSDNRSVFQQSSTMSDKDIERIKKNKEQLKQINMLSLAKLKYIKKNRWYVYKVDRTAQSISDSDSTTVSVSSKDKSNSSNNSIEISSCGFSVHSIEEIGDGETKSNASMKSEKKTDTSFKSIDLNDKTINNAFLNYNIYNTSFINKPVIDFEVENPLCVSL